jgi:uncharacterized membrane protein YdjX (TVP38/TMEM64 family)
LTLAAGSWFEDEMIRGRVLGVAAFGAAVAFGVAVWIVLGRIDPEATVRRVAEFGPIGPLVLVLVFIGQCVVAPIPSEPIMITAGLLYGPRAGFLIAWAGVVLGAAACFGLARRLGRPFAERFVRAERLDAIDAFVRRRGVLEAFVTILAVRVTAFSAFDVLSYACGLMPVRFAAFLLATALGAVPKAFAFTYAGANLAARPAWLDGLIVAGTLGILVAVPWLVRRRITRRPAP